MISANGCAAHPRIITAFITPRSVPAKAAAAPLGDMRLNPEVRLKDQFHEVVRFKPLSLRTVASEGTAPNPTWSERGCVVLDQPQHVERHAGNR
jgi:hypothetical protein